MTIHNAKEFRESQMKVVKQWQTLDYQKFFCPSDGIAGIYYTLLPQKGQTINADEYCE